MRTKNDIQIETTIRKKINVEKILVKNKQIKPDSNTKGEEKNSKKFQKQK